MTSITSPIRRGRGRTMRRATALVLALAVSTGGLLVATAGGVQAATAVPLGTADAYAVLAGTGITNTGPTTITGDVGTAPTPSITGQNDITLVPPSAYHQADAEAIQAKVDLSAGYTNAAGQSRSADSGAELGGQTLVEGVYGTDSALGLTGTVTLDGAGKTDGVWVFQAGSTLITASSSSVVLINGATACNVYWQVGSSATLGTSTSFVGTILASESISATTGATIQGRLLAQNGAVTLDTNTITRPNCATDSPEESSASSAASSYLSSVSSAASVSSEQAASSSAAAASSSAAAAAAAAAEAAAAEAAAAAAAQAAADAAAAANGFGQVRQVPVGSVDTGDGSVAGAGTSAVADGLTKVGLR
ncbi:MAG: ice-binding family protein [Nakamurella sp.]